MSQISIVIPAYNESGTVGPTVLAAKDAFANTSHDVEIIVVDDGSTDDTGAEAEEAGAVVIRHPKSMGYGNALLTGVHNAKHPWIGITDADSTYPVDALPSMLDEVEERGLDMLVGARQGKYYQGSSIKRWARVIFKALSEFTVGQRIPDINSGLRVIRRDMITRFAPVLSGGFSFTTTITIIGFLTHHFIDYTPIDYFPRKGASKVRYFRDTLRATQIILTTIVFFNPIKLYLLHSFAIGIAGGIAALLCVVFPALRIALLIGVVSLSAALLLLGMGFLAEQYRMHSFGITMRKRGSTYRAVSSADSETVVKSGSVR